MSDGSKIEWTDATWNPIRGCSRVSAGCQHCYAEATAARWSDSWGRGLAERTPSGPRWTGKVALVESRLLQPLRWRAPRRIFVASISDPFHESVPDDWLDRIFAVMALAPQHTFQVLTKRPERMRAYLKGSWQARLLPWLREWTPRPPGRGVVLDTAGLALRNVWLGVSIEDQETADERIPLLLETPAAHRFVSAEPLLDLVDLIGKDEQGSCLHTCDDRPALDWVIAGGESGPGARVCALEWIATLVRQCAGAQVPIFVKQLGANPSLEGLERRRGDHHHLLEDIRHRKGAETSEWPEALRVREIPC